MKAEYNVESAVGQVGHQSEKIKALEVANTYNFMLYLSHYIGHLEQLETMRNIGDIQEMSMLEMMHLIISIQIAILTFNMIKIQPYIIAMHFLPNKL